MNSVLHVLCIGSDSESAKLRDLLQTRQRCRLTVVGDYRQLSVLHRAEICEVAVLHGSLAPQELRDSCAWIRHAWPMAQILLLAPAAKSLEDFLYDERLSPEAEPEALLRILEYMAAMARRTEVRRSQQYRPHRNTDHGECRKRE